MSTHRKTHFPHPDAALFEAAGLAWLGGVDGGARVAEVLSARAGLLELEQIDDGHATPEAARVFGAALARTHAAGAPAYGFVPGTTPLFMGRLELPAPDPAPVTWGEFYATERVLPYLRRAVEQGRIHGSDERTIEAVVTRLLDGDLEHEQPALVHGAARLHGDLWNGNVLWAPEGAVLIDPTAHGGHAETDLAMLALFGAPYLEEILTGYDETSALAPGWQHRVDLHQLNPLLVHTVLFGGSYAAAAVAAAFPYT
ncbi:fructosamine kinase family protein [Pseudactinotalea sp.]|uniref:fructosamine kinase family protein n=1 Tax=Pseudactinotalea sp. TaxID=1926260 RepID=UPI003B3ABAC6